MQWLYRDLSDIRLISLTNSTAFNWLFSCALYLPTGFSLSALVSESVSVWSAGLINAGPCFWQGHGSWYANTLIITWLICKTKTAHWLSRLVKQCSPGHYSRYNHTSWFFYYFSLELQTPSSHFMSPVWRWTRTHDPCEQGLGDNHLGTPVISYHLSSTLPGL